MNLSKTETCELTIIYNWLNVGLTDAQQGRI